MFTFNVRKLFRKTCESEGTTSPTRQKPCPSFRPRLEVLEDRTLLSTSSLTLPAAADTTPQPAATLGQWMQLMATVENGVSNAWILIAQQVRYAQQEWMDLLGIIASAENPSLSTITPQVGSGTTMIQQPAGSTMSIPRVKPQASDSPNNGGDFGFLWDPVNGTNASNGHNWDYKGKSQKTVPNPVRPGDAPESVLFDPQATKQPGLNGNGASNITWDYNPAHPISILLGGGSAYTGTQTINSGVTVDCSVTANNYSSALNLDFLAASSTFQIDGDSTIPSMSLTAVDRKAQFIINSGRTVIGQQSYYTYNIGVQFTVAAGATLTDFSENAVTFTNNNLLFAVKGTVNASSSSVVWFQTQNQGITGSYIDVIGGTFNCNGQPGDTETIAVPVEVDRGAFNVNDGGNIVLNFYATWGPGNTPASLYMTSGSVNLSASVTLECDAGYYQSGGTMTRSDATVCTLAAGPTGSVSATFAGGSLLINFPGPLTAYAAFNVNCGTLNLACSFGLAINGKAQGAGSCDVLNVTGTTNLQGASLSVIVNNAPPNGGSKWVIIQDPPGKNIQNGGGLPINTTPQTNLNGSVNNNQYILSF